MACAFAAQAQVARPGDYLAKMDVDRDGKVSLVEYQDWLSYAFDAMDRDHDGVPNRWDRYDNRGYGDRDRDGVPDRYDRRDDRRQDRRDDRSDNRKYSH